MILSRKTQAPSFALQYTDVNTYKRLLPRMRPIMNIKVRLLRKTLPTVRQQASILALLARPGQLSLISEQTAWRRHRITSVAWISRWCELLQWWQGLLHWDRGSRGYRLSLLSLRLSLDGFHEDVDFGGELGFWACLFRGIAVC